MCILNRAAYDSLSIMYAILIPIIMANILLDVYHILLYIDKYQ